VEVIPLSVELWLTLARLETPERAKAVLNKARKAIPTSHEIWIAAGRLLEEQAMVEGKAEAEKQKELDLVDRTVEMAVKELRKHQVLLTREQWLKEAETCELNQSPRTCEAIVKATITMDIEEEDRFDIWLSDAEAAAAKGRTETARAILTYTLRMYPDRVEAWRRAAQLERESGSQEAYLATLERAVHYCPQAEELWLRSAKEKWVMGDVPGAREILEQAFVANPESESIWLAAVKLEAESGEKEVARELLVRARTVADTARVCALRFIRFATHAESDRSG
jgi:pre-mRNA-processing factor 6